LRKGRSFVTNGPMLELSVDGQELGSVIKLAGPGKLMVKARARSLLPLAKVELLVNGQVAQTLSLTKDERSAELDQAVDVDRSGWLALRATGSGPFAHTAPIYVEVGGASVRSRADAQFFLKWIDDLAVMVRSRDRVPNDELRRHVDGQLDA